MKRRKALTLIELLAATALAVLLMIAMIGILKSISLQRRILDNQASAIGWRTRLLERLRWDFANARTMSVTTEELQLIGFLDRDSSNGEPTHRASEVRYSVVDDGQNRWLARSERECGITLNRPQRTELVCIRVGAIEVLDADEDESPIHQSKRLPPRPPIKHSPIPASVRIVFHDETINGAPLLDERLTLRFEPR